MMFKIRLQEFQTHKAIGIYTNEFCIADSKEIPTKKIFFYRSLDLIKSIDAEYINIDGKIIFNSTFGEIPYEF